jgi:hypothetical protein
MIGKQGRIPNSATVSFPWLQVVVDTSSAATAATQLPADTDERRHLQSSNNSNNGPSCQRRAPYQRLSSSQSASVTLRMSGYLLNDPSRPPVWRRVHCVLTDDYLWYVSRVYAYTDGSNGSDSNHSNSNHSSSHAAKYQTPPMARHVV